MDALMVLVPVVQTHWVLRLAELALGHLQRFRVGLSERPRKNARASGWLESGRRILRHRWPIVPRGGGCPACAPRNDSSLNWLCRRLRQVLLHLGLLLIVPALLL